MSSVLSNMEKWKQVEDFTNYEISSYGRVRKGERVLTPQIHRYVNILFWKDKKYHMRYVHRLVAQAFMSNEKETVNHIDGDKHNNNVDNLEWATRSENMKHAWDTGLCKGYDKTGKNNPNYKHGNRMNNKT